jgi:FHS family L-fucose permease-like MFS transporter
MPLFVNVLVNKSTKGSLLMSHSTGPIANKKTLRYNHTLYIMTALFFMWGFLTCLNDIVIPHLKALFDLNYTQAMLVQFCFFATYALMSIPMSLLLKKIHYKWGMVLGLVIAACGCLLFIPAASWMTYPLFLFGFFVLASGIVLLQVAANPYVTLLGRPETASSRLTFTQAMNSLGTTLAPLFGGLLILSVPIIEKGKLALMSPAAITHYHHTMADTVKLPYILLASTLIIIAVALATLHLPDVETQDEGHSHHTKGTIWQHPNLIFGVIAIFCYVGAEVSTGSFLVNYLNEPTIGNLGPNIAAHYVAYFWGGAMLGRFIGAWVLTQINPAKIIAFNAVTAIALLLITSFSHGALAMWTVIALGLFNSILFPTIFSIAVDGLGLLRSFGSGLLCTAIVGGAVIPEIQGLFADHIGIQHAFLVLIIPYLYIAAYGLFNRQHASLTHHL